jgi:hypothetical protein
VSDSRLDAIRFFAEDRWQAHQILFRHRHPDTSSEAHKEIVRLVHAPHPRQGIEGFRGIAKSTLLEEAAVIRKCFLEFKNMVIVGASYTRAVDRLAAVKREFEINPAIPELFGELKLQATTWQEGKIVFADGSCIQAIGRDQSMTGMKHLDWRPDAALVDDLEDPEEVRGDTDRERTWEWFLETFLPSLDNPVGSWVRVIGTRRGRGSLPERLEEEAGWPVAKFPIEYKDPGTGERRATWPAKFPLAKVDAIRDLYRGKMDIYVQEYMCQATSARHQDFQRGMIRVVARPRTWEAVYGFIDPASSVNRGSATTGWAVWSWIRNRLIVWGSGADRLLPDEVVKLAYDLIHRYNLVWLGVERDALNQFLMQPLRQEQIRRGLAVVPLKPVAAISGTKGGGKLAFIRGLQPFFANGEVEFAEEMPDLTAQLLSFPYGPIDAPNALAYAQMLRPGLPVFDNFGDENIVQGLEPVAGRPMFLAGNAEEGIVSAVLLQRAEGELRIFADWVREGSAAELVGDIHTEAALMAETGEWEERVLGDPDQPYKLPVRYDAWARLPLRWVVPGRHRDTWSNVGLMQAIRAIPQGVSAADGGLERGRPALAAMLAQHQHGRPRVLVSPTARWTLRALTGGYSRGMSRSGISEREPEKGLYRVLMEGVESFAAVGAAVEGSVADQQPVAFDRNGVGYRSAMPARAR